MTQMQLTRSKVVSRCRAASRLALNYASGLAQHNTASNQREARAAGGAAGGAAPLPCITVHKAEPMYDANVLTKYRRAPD